MTEKFEYRPGLCTRSTESAWVNCLQDLVELFTDILNVAELSTGSSLPVYKGILL